MPTRIELESAHRRAASIADQVQLRIIATKQARGEALYPDEEELLSRHQTGSSKEKISLNFYGDAKVLLFQNIDFERLRFGVKNELITRLAKILKLSWEIKVHFEQKGLSSDFDKVDELEVIRQWDVTAAENTVLWAFHLASGNVSIEEVVKELIVKQLGT